MKVTREIADKLGDERKIRLEAEIIEELASRLGISPEKAAELFYSSDIAAMIEENSFGTRYLEAAYLVDEMLRRS